MNFGFIFQGDGRRFVDGRPKNAEQLDRLHELGEIHGLHHVGVDPVPVTLDHVRRFARGRKHDHGYDLQMLVGLDDLQHFQPADLGQLEVEQHQDGMAVRAGFEFSPAIKIIQRLRAVVDDRDLVGQIMLRQRGQRQFHVPRIVFDQQDFFDA